MSEAVRTALASAANTVEGVAVTPYYTQTTREGSGMVRLERLDRDSNGFGYVATWQVMVLLPQDLASAEKYLEAKVPALTAALEDHMALAVIEPRQLVLEGGLTCPAVVFEGHRESE